MVSDHFAPRPHAGRVITMQQRVGLGHTRPDGSVRLDALAGFVQDVADEDAATAPIDDDASVWVLRRTAFSFAHTPRFRDTLTLATWCSGTGARWAERRTDVTRGNDLLVSVVALWVHVTRATGRPSPLPDGFDTVWGATAGDRKVRARLAHGPPVADTARRAWPLRASDIDIVGHVNNAAYWAAVEDELARRGSPRVARAVIEFGGGIDPGDGVDLLVADHEGGFMTWFVVGEDARASASVGWRA